MPDIAAILQSLPDLSAKDLRAVSDRCQVLLKIGGGNVKRDTQTPDDFPQMLYDAIAREMQQRTQHTSKPWHVFLRTGAGRNFEQSALLLADAHKRWYSLVTSVQLVSIVRMYAELLLDYHASASLPTTWPILAHTTESLPSIVESAYPGYIGSGMLDMVLEMRTKGGAMNTA